MACFLSDRCVDCLIILWLHGWRNGWPFVCQADWLSCWNGDTLNVWLLRWLFHSADDCVADGRTGLLLPMDGLACWRQPPFRTFLITQRKPRCLLKGFCVLRQPLFTHKLPTMLHNFVYWLHRSSLESSNKGRLNWHPKSLNAAS